MSGQAPPRAKARKKKKKKAKPKRKGSPRRDRSVWRRMETSVEQRRLLAVRLRAALLLDTLGTPGQLATLRARAALERSSII
jgi:hypothetical protein